jgi:hypothetical protein
MKRSEVEKWIADNGGQKGQAQIEYIDVPNPAYNPLVHGPENKTRKVKQVTWTTNNGQTLSVIDDGKVTEPGDPGFASGPAGPDPGMPGGTTAGQVVPEPVYEVVGGGPKEAKEPAPRTAEQERDDKMIIAQKEKNFQQTGIWESDQERERREKTARDEARQQQIDQQNAANEATRIGIAQAAEARAAAAQQAQDQRAQESSARDRERLDIEKDRYQFERDRANRPQVLGTPTDDQKNIGVFNPVTGLVEAQSNPLYDQAKADAKAKQEELALAIQMNKLNAEQAAQIYTQWFKENVEVPFMMASERRAQTAEKRAALEAEERKRQFAASHSVQRAQLGQQAANTMIDAEIGMLPHRVGPKFGAQISSAINSLAAGGTLNGPSASAGINFTADAFEYEAPDLKKIARQATKAALKGVTEYDPDEGGPMPSTSYEGLNMPGADIMAGAPKAPNYIDTNSMYQNWINSRYPGPSQ